MKKTILIIIVILVSVIVALNVNDSQNSKNSSRKRLESAITYPSYMTANYKEGENAGCSGYECVPRMEITFGNTSINKAEYDLRSEIVKRGYQKSGENDYKTTDQSKLCQTIGIWNGTFDKSKLYITCY